MLSTHIVSHRQNGNVALASLYGLVLCGGKSTRMRQDKATLRYHGRIQVAHAFELLCTCCEKVFLSSRKEQAHLYGQFPQIHDTYQDVGPLSGILSAMTTFPGVAWFVLANDMPYVDVKTIRTLIRRRDPEKEAVAYQNPQGHFPEPLCAIYEPNLQVQLLKSLKLERYSLRRILESADIRLVFPPNDFALFNVNSPEDYKQAVEFLQDE